VDSRLRGNDKKIMAFLIKLTLWALAFVPLIVNTSVFFPFIFGKILIIRIFIALASLLFAVHLVANEEFRRETYGRAKRIFKSPVFVMTTAFMAIFAISTYFAVNPFRAFFGDVERGEGLLGFLYFYAFFVYSLLLFEKKDWVMFFKLNLVTGAILFIKELFELCPTNEAGLTICNWGGRPGSFTGNPAFLGGYLLFVVFAALVVLYYAKKEPIWRWFATTMIPVGVIGLFITQTRAAMLGLVMGTLALVVYGVFHGKDITVRKNISLRTASAWVLIVMTLVGGIFYATRSNSFWKNIPGFNRAATFTLNDFTVQTRLISLGVSKNAIDPQKNGLQKFLIGWGPENFSIAYNQYYNPDYYHLEHTWFDRAHNKLMDVAVMNGILGLLVYLGIWISVGWLVFRKKGFSFDMMAILFFATAFFFNLLFVFDQISTIIPFFAFLAFAVTVASLEPEKAAVAHSTPKKTHFDKEASAVDYAAYGAAGVATVFFLWGLIFWTLVPMSQMNNYLAAIRDQKFGLIVQQPGAIFEPYTFAQQDIRSHFLTVGVANYSNPQAKSLFDLSLLKMEELIQREGMNPRFLVTIASVYDRMGKTTGDEQYLKKAEEYYKTALRLAPMRQDVVYAYSLNLSYQGRAQEAITLLRDELVVDSISPETHYYLGIVIMGSGGDYKEALRELEIAMQSSTLAGSRDEFVRNLYRAILRAAYEHRDKERFIIAAERLAVIDTEQSKNALLMKEMVEKGQWPAVDFQ